MSTEVQIILSKYVNELEKIYGTYLMEVVLYRRNSESGDEKEIY